MLNLGKKILILYSILILLISCKESEEEHIDGFEGYKKHYFFHYNNLYSCINDSLNFWILDSLKITGLQFKNSWMLDSIICFNIDSTRFFSTILNRDTIYKNSTQESVQELGGAIINGKWYFFFLGSTMVVPREMYQSDVHTPLSFQKLSEIAHEQLHSGAIIFNKDGTYKPNEAFFKRKFNSTVFQGCTGNDTEACYDSMTVVHCKEKYKYKLTKEEIEEINRAIKESGESSL